MFLPQPMPEAFKAGLPFDMAARRPQIRADGAEAALMPAGLTRSALSYRTCRMPVRVIQSDCDMVVNPHLHGRLLAAILPDATFTSAPGLGRMAHHVVPELVRDAIASLVARKTSQASLVA